MITDLAWDDISVPGQYKAYITFIGVLEEYQGMLSKRILFNSLIAQLVNLAKFGVYFSEITACGFTKQGKNACMGIGMEKICDHCDLDNVGVFKLNLIPFPMHLKIKLKDYDELITLYYNIDLI